MAPTPSTPASPCAWPYPRWIAHRGAGRLAPENTMAAFRLGAQHGFRMFECDVKLSADGIPFLLHDTTLERTTSGTGRAGDLAWGALSQLDAGSWHSRGHAGEPLATFENLARYCLRNGYHLNIEIKPSPGVEYLTGETVARHAARLWQDAEVPPLLTSFKPEALAGVRAAAPGLPRGLLFDALHGGWLEEALALGCVAVVANHTQWTADAVARVHGAGLRALSYTVNDLWAAEWLAGLGTDGIITDRIDLFVPL